MSKSVPFTEGYNNPMGQGFSNFGSKKLITGSKEFLMSNTIVAKVAFLLLVIIGFVLLLRLSTQLILWYNKPDPNPYLVTCRRDGELHKVIPGSPNIKNSIPVIRSKDERTGVEFTWSIWLFVDKPHPATPGNETTVPRYYHIFHKGTGGSSGILSSTNMDATPGLYIKSIEEGTQNTLKNSLVAVTNTFSGEVIGSLTGGVNNIENSTVIENIPLRKWIHVALRVENKNFDVYVNGILAKRRVLPSLPRQNYGDVHIASGDSTNKTTGFNGEISSLRYFNSALNPVEISNIVKVGPNMCTDDSAAQYPPYFSQRWYL